MTYRRQALAVTLLVIAAAFTIAAQTKAGEREVPTDVQAKIVSFVLTQRFKPAVEPVTIELYPDNLQWEYLPVIRNVTFVILTENEIRERGIKAYFFQKAKQDDDGNIIVDFGYGDPRCNASGSTWAFDETGEVDWDKSKGGWGTGCGSGNGRGKGKSP